MQITLNGEATEVLATTLDSLLAELGFEDAIVATALNGDFVSVRARAHKTLNDGDRLEIVAPMQGG